MSFKDENAKLERSWFKTLGLFSAASSQLVMSVWLLAWIGSWLDKQFTTEFLQILFAFLGLIQGFFFFYRIFKQNENR